MRRLLVALVLVLAAMRGAAALPLGPGEPLDAAFAESLLRDALDAAGLAPPYDLRIDEPRLPLANQSGETTEITVEGLDHDMARGRFAGVLVGRIGERPRFRLPVRGRAVELIELPVLARPLDPGELVRAEDLIWTTVHPNRLPAGGVVHASELVGAEAKRRLLPGRPLRGRDVGPPRLVQRGQSVRLVYRTPGLRIAAIGTAQDDGALGEPVRVLNPASRRQVTGVVSGPNEVSVGGGVPAPGRYPGASR